MVPAPPGRDVAADTPGRLRPRERSAVAERLLGLVVLAALLAVFAAQVPDSYALLRGGTLGILLDADGEEQFVLTPIPGQPAALAGVRAGDVLLAVDGEPIATASGTPELLSRLRNAPGVPVTLTVARPDGGVTDVTFERSHAASEKLGISPGTYALTLIAVGVLFVLGFAVPAAIIALRRPHDWVAALVWLALVLIAMVNSRASTALRNSDGPVELAIAAAYHVAVFLVLLTFPDGRLVPRWTRWYLPVGVAWIAIRLAPTPATQALLDFPPWILIDFVVFGLAVAAQYSRYRGTTDPGAKQQTKWLVYGFVVAFLVQYAYYVPYEFVTTFRGRSVFEFVGSIVHHVLMLIVPVAFTHAVLRHRLYQIDLVINRTLVYVPLTAILAGVFSTSITLFRNLFATLTGASSDVATLLSILIIVALLTPVKDRLQRIVDERFRYSSRAERVLKDFEVQVASRLQTVQAGPAIRRLLEHAVRGFDALGGTAELLEFGKTRTLGTAGEWSGDGVVSVPVQTGEQTYGHVILGAHRHGAGFTEADLDRLRSAAAVVAAAIEEDRQL